MHARDDRIPCRVISSPAIYGLVGMQSWAERKMHRGQSNYGVILWRKVLARIIPQSRAGVEERLHKATGRHLLVHSKARAPATAPVRCPANQRRSLPALRDVLSAAVWPDTQLRGGQVSLVGQPSLPSAAVLPSTLFQSPASKVLPPSSAAPPILPFLPPQLPRLAVSRPWRWRHSPSHRTSSLRFARPAPIPRPVPKPQSSLTTRRGRVYTIIFLHQLTSSELGPIRCSAEPVGPGFSLMSIRDLKPERVTRENGIPAAARYPIDHTAGRCPGRCP